MITSLLTGGGVSICLPLLLDWFASDWPILLDTRGAGVEGLTSVAPVEAM